MICLMCNNTFSKSGLCTSCVLELEEQLDRDIEDMRHECFSDKNPPCSYCDPLVAVGIVEVDGEIVVLSNEELGR